MLFDGAPCKEMDVNVFFPEHSPGDTARSACSVCAWTTECRLIGAGQRYGIFAGVGEKGRRAERAKALEYLRRTQVVSANTNTGDMFYGVAVRVLEDAEIIGLEDALRKHGFNDEEVAFWCREAIADAA